MAYLRNTYSRVDTRDFARLENLTEPLIKEGIDNLNSYLEQPSPNKTNI